MQLQDIQSIDDMKKQAGIYGVMAAQIADDLQDLKKVVAKNKSIDIYERLLTELDEAQHQLYGSTFCGAF